MAIIQQTLEEAMKDAKLCSLPKEAEMDAPWVEAIALVDRMAAGIQSYALVKKVAGKVIVVHDYGFSYQCNGIKEIKHIYPYYSFEEETPVTEEIPLKEPMALQKAANNSAKKVVRKATISKKTVVRGRPRKSK